MLRKQREELKHKEELYKVLESSADTFVQEQPDFESLLPKDPGGYVSIGDGLEAFHEYILQTKDTPRYTNKPVIAPPPKSSHARLALMNYILGFKKIRAKYNPLLIVIFMLSITLISISAEIPKDVKHLTPGYATSRARYTNLLTVPGSTKSGGGGLDTSEEIEASVLEVTDGREVLGSDDLQSVINLLFEGVLSSDDGSP
jgi:hypothetical protein